MRWCAFLILLVSSLAAQADETVTVAVASNFKTTAVLLAGRFHEDSGHTVLLSSGATGKLYAQIVNGAPFDVFLAADAERPALLEQNGHAVRGSRFTYAVGGLVIVSGSVDDCLAALRDPLAGHVAIANPATAPYGVATRQYLEREGLWESVAARAAYGENIMQAWQFVITGNAVIGFAARAQLRAAPRQPRCVYEIPPGSHDPLEQQAVLLAENNTAATAFLEFLRSGVARTIIEQAGYGVPR